MPKRCPTAASSLSSSPAKAVADCASLKNGATISSFNRESAMCDRLCIDYLFPCFGPEPPYQGTNGEDERDRSEPGVEEIVDVELDACQSGQEQGRGQHRGQQAALFCTPQQGDGKSGGHCDHGVGVGFDARVEDAH